MPNNESEREPMSKAKKKPVAERIAERLFNDSGDKAIQLARIHSHPNYEDGHEHYPLCIHRLDRESVIRIINEELSAPPTQERTHDNAK